jgi:hypothetical protein
MSSEQKVDDIKYPVHDFLTDEMIDLLRNIKNKKLQNALTLFYSDVPSGKTTFLKILQNFFKCKLLSIQSFRKYVLNELNNDELKDYEIIILAELDRKNIDIITETQFIEKLSLLGSHVMGVTNELPEDFKSKIELLKNNNYTVNVIEFKNYYCQDVDAELQRLKANDSYKNSEYSIKQSLDNYEDIANEKAFQIIRKYLSTESDSL